MRDAAQKDFVRLATTTNGPVAKIVRNSIEVGVVFPSKLEANLKAAGFAVNYKSGNVNQFVLVTADSATEYDDNNTNIVARAQSHDAPDALLQAMYAELKEEARVLDIAAKLSKNPDCADTEILKQLAACAAKPELLTRELLVAVASDKAQMALLAAL